jgi:sulfatase maturation enzyme AslB (radical SAM superfamily)
MDPAVKRHWGKGERSGQSEKRKDEKRKDRCAKDMTAMALKQPIARWLDLVRTPLGPDHLEELKAIYRERPPTQGELIFTGECEFACRHCIYHPQYAKHNGTLTVDEWNRILFDLNQGLGIDTFVYGGRSVTRDGLAVLRDLRASFPHARIGLIDNGISLRPYREDLAELGLDWIDISLDGMEAEHDLQRGRKGSFREALLSLRWLAEHDVAPKINILTCLTTMNQAAIVPLIQSLNREGFTNVFITPVSIMDGVRPSKSLQVLGQPFVNLIEMIQSLLGSLKDAWLEVNMFGVEYLEAIMRQTSPQWQQFEAEDDHLSWRFTEGDNELSLNYLPESLTGIRELIVNSNGDVIPPKTMAKGRIPEDQILGSLLTHSAREIVARVSGTLQFSFYERELLREVQVGRRIAWQQPIPVR